MADFDINFVIADNSHVQRICDLTNKAFIADAFFKKDNYKVRFKTENIAAMMNSKNSIFLCLLENDGSIVGSLYIQISVIFSNESASTCVKGHISAVAVAPGKQRCGYGTILVREAESYVGKAGRKLCVQDDQSNILKHNDITVVVELNVVNVRSELLTWYSRLGYEIIEEIRPPEFMALVADEWSSVCLVTTRKVLQFE